jgi:integrase
VVRWRDNGAQRARRFKTEAEALAFDEGISGGSQARSSTPNIYPYETSDGMRWRYSYRDSRGRLSTKRGFPTERAAARDREETMARVRQGALVVSRMTFGEFFPLWLRRRRPYVTAGTFADYDAHGRKRLLPHFADARLTAITTFDVRDWLLELHEAGEYAPKTLNNALGVLVAALNGAVVDQLLPLNPAVGVERLPLGHVERDWLRLHEIDPYLDACLPVYRPLAELLVASGMRVSEALALRWDDIDFPRRVLRVYRSATPDGEGPTKGKRFRSVQVGPRLLDTLRDLRARRAELDATDLTRARVFTRRAVREAHSRADRHRQGQAVRIRLPAAPARAAYEPLWRLGRLPLLRVRRERLRRGA